MLFRTARNALKQCDIEWSMRHGASSQPSWWPPGKACARAAICPSNFGDIGGRNAAPTRRLPLFTGVAAVSLVQPVIRR